MKGAIRIPDGQSATGRPNGGQRAGEEWRESVRRRGTQVVGNAPHWRSGQLRAWKSVIILRVIVNTRMSRPFMP